MFGLKQMPKKPTLALMFYSNKNNWYKTLSTNVPVYYRPEYKDWISVLVSHNLSQKQLLCIPI